MLYGEPGADLVGRIIRDDPLAVLTAVGLAEVLDHLFRVAGADEEDAVLDVAMLGLARPLVVDEDIALRAGLLRARHYHRRNRAISLADAVAAEAARRHAPALGCVRPAPPRHLSRRGHPAHRAPRHERRGVATVVLTGRGSGCGPARA